jgi:rubrerythrin
MEHKDILDMLGSLAQLDVDAYHAYEQAIEKVEVASIRDELTKYQQDHLRHYQEISRRIQEMGGSAPEFAQDFKGYFIAGFTSLRSVTGTKGALEAMQSNEKMTNKNYQEASSHADLPRELHEMLITFYQDERIHLSFIESALNEKVWELKETV